MAAHTQRSLGPPSTFACVATNQERGGATERYDDVEFAPSTDPRQTTSHEPKWTLYSSLFRLTLDYILAAKQDGAYPQVTALLSLHPQHVLEKGIPMKGVCASDHMLLGAEYVFG